MSLRLHILFVFLLFAVITTWGYNFGRGDQAEIIPYSLYLSKNWSGELPLFVQNINSYFPNERFTIAKILAFFGEFLPIITLFFHLITTYFLVIGILKIAQIFLKEHLAFCVVWLIMLPLWGIHYGGNELYYNNFQASTLSKSIAIWGLYFFLTHQISKSFYLFSISTIVHLLAGLQIGLLIFITHIIKQYIENQKIRIYISQIIFLFIAISYALTMKYSLDNDNPLISDADYFIAMFYWKFNEHYAVFDFQKFGLILYLGSIISILIFLKNNIFFKIFIILQILGAIIYLLGFYVFQSNFITSIQWFKTTIWIKLFGIIAFIGLLNSWLSRIKNTKWFIPFELMILGLVVLIFQFNRIFLAMGSVGILFLVIRRKISDNVLITIISFIIFCGLINYSNRVPLDMFFLEDDKVKLCKEIKKINEKMLVIVPIHFTELESYAQQCSYVNFIATPKKNSYFAIYLKRIEEVYGLKPKKYPIKKEIELAKRFYNQRSWKEWLKFKQKGVTHIITENQEYKEVKPLIKIGNWYLWKL